VTTAAVVILSSFAVLAAPAPRPEDPGDQARATLHRVAQMTAEGQRAWLDQLQSRLLAVDKLILPADEAAREQTRITAFLQQKKVPWQGLVELVRLLDQREKTAVSRLVRQYRSQVYETFREDHRTLIARQEAWFRVWRAWETGGSQPDQQDRLLAWLDAAIHSMAAGAARLPPDPDFPPLLAATEPLKKEAMPPAATPPSTKPAEAQPEVNVRPPQPMIQPQRPLPEPTIAAAGPDGRVAQLRLLPPPEAVQVPGAACKPGLSPPARHWAAQHEPSPVPELAMMPRAALKIALPPAQAAAPAPPPAAEEALPKPPAAEPKLPVAEAEKPGVQVNVEELAVRIAGNNLALRGLEAELNENRTWSADQLENVLSRLDILVLRQKDLTLFRDLVSAAEQARAGRTESPRHVISQLAARIVEVRNRLTAGEATIAEELRRAQLEHLDQLSQRLAALAAEK
jgi:hypothetical protein